MWKKTARNMLYMLAGILRMPFVDFQWSVVKYGAAFVAIDRFREDGYFTDEEVGEVFEFLAYRQPRLLKLALFSVGGFFKSKLVDFKWSVAEYHPVFNQLKKMHEDDVFEDEELAEFCIVLADTLFEEK